MENEKSLYDDLKEYLEYLKDLKAGYERTIMKMLKQVLSKHGVEREKIDQILFSDNLLVENGKRKDVEYILRKNRRNYWN